ncbi:similar to Saccharomyces cerevisiae YFL049W SWP82 Member of the SWI/SNF chromatin remodeling complex in which it plays an as yet unidentified role [Maudiozyma saulgeensis]|uniref:Similar to Saccharomyces cerevisiae YFL049W SWP82 Member of the SWI/SNF chromatin remodeling complex in which it plays an as yet unidentified role n=1 Tax=Maudiozyma saulgeensis TaxID=1789683 RepID=A0A1X7QYS1_9SACH|nr:similar to Saccharomyces cerevisiae YFL049W SWP82 Member of the SWI/SNF chromatin remodeling complex in which it plays an as yet unidentified role [Kazachstania saulgeensis]
MSTTTSTSNNNNDNDNVKIKGTVQMVKPKTLHSHELFLVKHTVPLAGQDELLQGPLNQFPQKTLVIPPDCFNKQIIEKDKLLEYPLSQRDPVGERKISIFGQLLNGSKYLFNTFTLARIGQTHFLLVKDLIQALQYELSMPDFLNQYDILITHLPTAEDIEFLIDNQIIQDNIRATEERESYKFITCKAAFVIFGASVVASGHRLADDYWETIGKQQGLTQHHRVHKLPQRLIRLVYQLKPSLNDSMFTRIEKDDHIIPTDEEITLSKEPISFVSPYPTITEQPSKEIKDEYLLQFSKGQHITTVMPGQSINDAMELTAQFKVPKYHSKNSFLQATQSKALDVPIGKSLEEINNSNNNINNANLDSSMGSLSSMTSFSNSVKGAIAGRNNSNHNLNNINNYSDNIESETTTAAASPNFTQSKPMSRMLSNILSDSKSKKNDDNTDSHAPSTSTTTHSKTNAILNINGWKFETLPIRENPIQMMNTIDDTYTYRGLPIYQRDSLLVKLNTLTPNQIKEVEYLHDSLFFNTGVQRMRSMRKKKWGKYWQYKTGIPIGLKANQIKQLQTKTLSEMLAVTDTQEIFNEETTTDEIHTTRRVPNGNFYGFANIRTRKPPYANIPQEVLEQMRVNGNVGQHVVQTNTIADNDALNDAKRNDMEQTIKNENNSDK